MGFAISQLAQTTLRSEIGKIELDRTFEARGQINTNVVSELDKASSPWGVKVLRYEIKNITPPKDVLSAMEKQMRAEREKRAVILTSEGERDAKINAAEGDKQRVIKQSEANKQQQINEAEGQAQAILAVATATAEGLRQVGIALSDRGGIEAMQLRIGEEYVKQFGKLAQAGHDAGGAGESDGSGLHRDHGDQHRAQAATRARRRLAGRPSFQRAERHSWLRRAPPIRLGFLSLWCWRRRPCRRRPSPSTPCCRLSRPSCSALHVANPNHGQWIVTAYMTGLGVGQLFWGMISDRFGRRPILFGGLRSVRRRGAAVQFERQLSRRCSPGASCMVWRRPASP